MKLVLHRINPTFPNPCYLLHANSAKKAIHNLQDWQIHVSFNIKTVHWHWLLYFFALISSDMVLVWSRPWALFRPQYRMRLMKHWRNSLCLIPTGLLQVIIFMSHIIRNGIKRDRDIAINRIKVLVNAIIYENVVVWTDIFLWMMSNFAYSGCLVFTFTSLPRMMFL